MFSDKLRRMIVLDHFGSDGANEMVKVQIWVDALPLVEESGH